MQIVERDNINIEKWDGLVSANTSKFFSYSWYLDAVAENWCVLVDDKYTKGLALPYSKRLGVETLYTPIFCRYLEWLGNEGYDRIEELILQRFKSVEFSLRQPLLKCDSESFVYQEIMHREHKLGNQASRMLKKAEKNGLKYTKGVDVEIVLSLIESELKNSIKGIDDNSIPALKKLFDAALKAGVLVVYSTQNGGIVCLENDKEVLYLKGTVEDKEKKNGGMYLIINAAIEDALSIHKTFDFGGSRAEGVKRFNLNLGGQDQYYYHYRINNGPFWFKFARSISRKWKK